MEVQRAEWIYTGLILNIMFMIMFNFFFFFKHVSNVKAFLDKTSQESDFKSVFKCQALWPWNLIMIRSWYETTSTNLNRSYHYYQQQQQNWKILLQNVYSQEMCQLSALNTCQSDETHFAHDHINVNTSHIKSSWLDKNFPRKYNWQLHMSGTPVTLTLGHCHIKTGTNVWSPREVVIAQSLKYLIFIVSMKK